MDGKQARKTGNSTPLGLLFDHGCDSLVIMLQGLSLATVLQFGNGFKSLFNLKNKRIVIDLVFL